MGSLCSIIVCRKYVGEKSTGIVFDVEAHYANGYKRIIKDLDLKSGGPGRT